MAVLRALGCQIEREEDSPDALRRRQLEVLRDRTPPALVAWDGVAPPLPLQLEEREGAPRIEIRIELDGGGERSIVCDLAELEIVHREHAADQVFLRRHAALGEDLPLGCHKLTVVINERSSNTTIISAPSRAFRPRVEKREWGIFLPLYAAHDRDGHALGHFSHLDQLGSWAAMLGARVVSTLPLNAMFLEDPCIPSPYSPISRMFWSELYIDVAAAGRSAGWSSDGGGPSRSTQATPALIHYDAEMRDRRQTLERISEHAWSHDSTHKALREQVSLDPELDLFARFRTCVEGHGVDWRSWRGDAMDAASKGTPVDNGSWRYHVFCQVEARRQLGIVRDKLAENDVSLYLDLPLGAHPDGFDAWRRREIFARGASVGAPPDALFSEGQNWGFAPVDPRQSRLTGHRYFQDSLRAPLEFARVLRIDHAPALHRLYWIPEGAEATEGVYVHYAADEHYAMLNLESHRAGAHIIGEDLGAVPRYVTESLQTRGATTMCVAQLELDSDKAPELLDATPAEALACVNTHDTPTFAGFWRAADVEDRKALGLLSVMDLAREREKRAELRERVIKWLGADLTARPGAPEVGEVYEAILRRLAASPSLLLLVSLEDLWGETSPQNVPGTSAERPNWRRRSARAIDDIVSDPAIEGLLREINSIRRQPGSAGSA